MKGGPICSVTPFGILTANPSRDHELREEFCTMVFQSSGNGSVWNLATWLNQDRMHKNQAQTFSPSFKLDDVISISRENRGLQQKRKEVHWFFLSSFDYCLYR